LEAAQQGYSVVPEGDETDWREEWVVIGHEEMCGDPLFIDTDDDDYPVYTATHGMGEWSPRLIAFTFRHFVQILEQLQVLARGRSNPVELERRPITDQERESFLDFIRRESPDVEFAFWGRFVRQRRERANNAAALDEAMTLQFHIVAHGRRASERVR
jgi:hypothetical protein